MRALPSADTGGPSERRPGAAAARARIAPRTIQLLFVTVPSGFAPDSPVTYVVVPSGEGTLIPPLAGVLPPARGVPRRLAVGTSVPAGARAGVRGIGAVRFSQGDTRWATVPLELDVAQVRSVALRLTQQLFGARPGERVVLRYVLTNTGNALDTLDLTLVPPEGWTATHEPRRYVLDRGQSVTGELALAVPRAAGSGAFRVRLRVLARGTDVADADAVIELLEAPSGRAALGPLVTAGVAAVMANGQSASPVVGLELAGPVSDAVQAFGRLVEATNPGAVDERNLTRIGYFVGAPFLTLTAPTWQFTGGTTGRTFSPITGVSAYGSGASFAWSDSQSSVAALAAAPAAASGGPGGGHLLGVRVGSEIWAPGGQVNATVTNLEDPQFGGRRLAAVGLGAVTPPFAGVTVSGELAARQYEAGSGLGWLTEVTQRTQTDYAQVRYVAAPGGSAAFARARAEFAAIASRALGPRLSLGAGVWTSDDADPTFSRLHSTGWSFAPRYQLSDRTSLELEARSSAFTAQSAAGLLGNGETVVRVGVNTERGALYFSGGASVGSANEQAGLPGGPAVETTAGRQSVRATCGLATVRGTLELGGSLERNGPGIGYLPLQSVVSLRVSHAALSDAPGSPVLTLGLDHYSWFGDRPAVLVARAGVVAPLPGSLALTLDVERNPFLTGLLGGAQWIPVVKLTRAARLPIAVLEPVAKGVVYQDLNANGVRDPGEPGVAGAVVRRGSETIVTDGSGEFRFYERTDAPIRLDETSIPFGLVPNPTLPPERQPLGHVAIGLIPTAAVDVQLELRADSTGRVPRVELSGVPLAAVDTAGDVWSARADGTGRAHFYALPPGSYRLDVDLRGLSEPVRLGGAAPSFRVVAGHAVPLLTVPIYPSPIRTFPSAPPGPEREGGLSAPERP